jgi:hypothetical protein
MLTNELLEAKYRAQRALTDQGGDDLYEYALNLRRIVRDAERKHGLTFRYRQGAKETAPSHDVQTKSSSHTTVA